MSRDFRSHLKAALAAHEPQRLLIEDARPAAVLIPIVLQPEPTAILTVRTDTVRSHKGQISFPGGSVDEGDETLMNAALRETQEEIGLDPSAVEVIGELDTFPTFVSGYVVTPFVGLMDRMPSLRPNPAEVASILEVPLAHMTNEIHAAPGFTHGERTYPTEAWIWDGHVIWGVTARIVREFLTILGAAGLVEPPEGDMSFWDFPSARTGASRAARSEDDG